MFLWDDNGIRVGLSIYIYDRGMIMGFIMGFTMGDVYTYIYMFDHMIFQRSGAVNYIVFVHRNMKVSMLNHSMM